MGQWTHQIDVNVLKPDARGLETAQRRFGVALDFRALAELGDAEEVPHVDAELRPDESFLEVPDGGDNWLREVVEVLHVSS